MTTAGELWQKSLSSLEAGKRLLIFYFRQWISLRQQVNQLLQHPAALKVAV